MSNKALGNKAEELVANKLYEMGFWVHRLQQNAAGQPADIIAVRNEKTFLIDVKYCSNFNFKLERIEDNQRLAMTLWEKRAKTTPYFALVMPNEEIHMAQSWLLFSMKQNAILEEGYFRNLVTLEEWERVYA